MVSDALRAVVYDGNLRVVERDCPVLAADEALIRLRVAGVCNTDLELIAGYKGFAGVLGHEFVGEVIEGPDEWVGRRVVGEINVSCGDCDLCRRGLRTHCRQRRVLGLLNYDGAFADMFRLVTRNLIVVPDSLSDDEAVFAEPLAAACQVLEMATITPSARVIVIGAGKLGLLTAQVLRLTGVDLVVVARHPAQRVLLAQWGILSAERSELPNEQADVVVDCTGHPSGFAEALQLVRPRGVIVLKSTYVGDTPSDLTRIVVNEITVVGSRCGPFDAALRLLEQGLVDVQSLVQAHYSLDDAPLAFVHAARPGALKVLLTP